MTTKRNLKRVRGLVPVGLAMLAVTVFMGCRAEIAVRGGTYSERIWNSDPYCGYRTGYGYGYGYNDGYGCRYNDRDGLRIRIIQERRWDRGWRMQDAALLSAAGKAKPVSWASEFQLHSKAVKFLQSAFQNTLEGNSQQLQALGVTQEDIQAMESFHMPSDRSIAVAAKTLKVKQQDLKDFLEVFLIRMKAAFQANE